MEYKKKYQRTTWQCKCVQQIKIYGCFTVTLKKADEVVLSAKLTLCKLLQEWNRRWDGTEPILRNIISPISLSLVKYISCHESNLICGETAWKQILFMLSQVGTYGRKEQIQRCPSVICFLHWRLFRLKFAPFHQVLAPFYLINDYKSRCAFW